MLAKFVGRAFVGMLGAAALSLSIGAGTAGAQSNTQWDSLYDRIIRLEHKLRTLEAGGQQQPTTVTSIDPATSASQSLRIDRVESDLRTLLGQVQELAYKIQQLTDRLQRVTEDTEYRIQQLEAANGNSGQNNTTTSDTTRTANNGYQLPDYGDLSSLEQYPQENTDPVQLDPALPEGTQTLGTITIPESQVQDGTTTLSAIPDPVTSQPLDGTPETGGADALYQLSYNDLLRRRFDAAEQGFTKFLKLHGKHKLAGNAQYWLGESYYARGHYKKAAKAFLTGYRDYGASTKAPDSMLKLGMSLRRLGQKKHACATFSELSTRFPRASSQIKKLAARERQRTGCGG